MHSIDPAELATAFARFDKAPDLALVKDKLLNYYRTSSMYGNPLPGCFVFSGEPGSNTTKAARLLGEALKAIGILSSGHTVECTKQDFVSMFVGESAIKTRQLCSKALGGVLVIDEAYTLVNSNLAGGPYISPVDQEIYIELMSFTENNRDQMCVVFMGYPGTMDTFINANPGLKRRITLTIDFPEGNLNKSSDEESWEDDEIPVYQGSANEEILTQLGSLVGLFEVKQQLLRITNGACIYGSVPRYYAFIGGPGTGKNKVAHTLGALLKECGMLQTGHVVVCRREDLISPYVGGTAIKTKAVCESALGGILYIDEAYRLTDTFGRNEAVSLFEKEALETLINFAEAHCEQFCIVFSGYPVAMERFLAVDPWLKTRISTIIKFPDYSSDELSDIFERQASASGFSLAVGTKDAVRNAFTAMKAAKTRTFGNAREAYHLLNDCKDNIARRMLKLLQTGNKELIEKMKYIITPEDVPGEQEE